MAKHDDWAKNIVDSQTKAILAAISDRSLSGRARETRVRDALRTAIRETVKATSDEIQALMEARLGRYVPQYSTEQVARLLDIPLSTLRLYISRKLVTTPEKIANAWLWSDEDLERTKREIAAYRKSIADRRSHQDRQPRQ